MSKDIKDKKKKIEDGQENFILKKIRYYQGSIKDYETYWNDKIAEGEREESPETKSFAKRNAELNKAYEIIPVEKDDTTMCTDVTSGEVEKVSDNPDVKPDSEEGNKDAKKDAGLEAEKEGKKEDKKKEKKEEKHIEEEEEKADDAKKEEKGKDDKKKSKKKDKED